jgi:hypothetical protein
MSRSRLTAAPRREAGWYSLALRAGGRVLIPDPIRLNELREVRNAVMHFNPDPGPEDASAKLRLLIRLFLLQVGVGEPASDQQHA